MKFATFAKIAAVAGVMMASVFGQSLSAQAGETMTLGYTKVQWQTVDPRTRFAADLTVMDDGSAAGVIRIHKLSDVTLKRGVIAAASGTVVCDRDEPVLIVQGTYYEEIGGQLVARGPARAEARDGGNGGGAGITDFVIVGVASQTSAIEAVGRLSFDVDPCR